MTPNRSNPDGRGMRSLRRLPFRAPSSIRPLVLTAAFTLFAASFWGCEDPGVVGGTFIDEQGNLATNEYPVTRMELIEGNGYSGRLSHVPVGRYLDPVFGEVVSIGLIRPELDSLSITRIEPSDTMRFRFVFSSEVYGDTLSTARFDVYEINEPWRGMELRYGDRIGFDPTLKVGEFTVGDRDTVVFDVSPQWRARYREYLYDPLPESDSLYIYDMPGLAIVPRVDQTQKVVFLEVESTAIGANEEFATRLFVTDTTGTNEYQRMADWGAAYARTPLAGERTGSVPTFNTLEGFFDLDFQFSEEQLLTRNLARVELLVYQDELTLKGSLPENHIRPVVDQARIHIVNTGDPQEWIFSEAAEFTSTLDTTRNVYRFNLTSYANAFLFDTLATNRYYLSVESNNGFLRSTLLHDLDAEDESKRPRIVVTAIQ